VPVKLHASVLPEGKPATPAATNMPAHGRSLKPWAAQETISRNEMVLP
jgi:hypothetical protein